MTTKEYTVYEYEKAKVTVRHQKLSFGTKVKEREVDGFTEKYIVFEAIVTCDTWNRGTLMMQTGQRIFPEIWAMELGIDCRNLVCIEGKIDDDGRVILTYEKTETTVKILVKEAGT